MSHWWFKRPPKSVREKENEESQASEDTLKTQQALGRAPQGVVPRRASYHCSVSCVCFFLSLMICVMLLF